MCPQESTRTIKIHSSADAELNLKYILSSFCAMFSNENVKKKYYVIISCTCSFNFCGLWLLKGQFIRCIQSIRFMLTSAFSLNPTKETGSNRTGRLSQTVIVKFK